MRVAHSIPNEFKSHRAPSTHANEAFGEVMIGGIKTACLSRNDLARMMLADCFAAREIDGARPKLIFASNGHTMTLAAKDWDFRRTFESADLIHADSQAAVFASRLLTRTPLPQRSATTDFIHDAAVAAAEHGLRFYLLGATEENNEKAAAILARTYLGLQIVGRRHGYFSQLEEDDICDEINLTRPDVIWVGLSAPLEYKFAVRNRKRLKAGWLVTCGGCFNFITGHYARAPRWMQTAGLEWLHRLWREPRRLFWRYATSNPVAVFLLLTRTKTLPPEALAPVLVAPVRTAA
jgi:N-acetylglucosaminyldiphosphoundecaprenol N-acetyl-beta-D-mannosaminyltransferase